MTTMTVNPRLPFPARGLYAITREGYPDAAALALAVASAIRGGATAIQYRAKSAADPLDEAARLLAVCRAGRVPLIINDDVELAGQVGADGVHLGRDDVGLAEAKRLLGPDAIVGVSCYDSVDQAELAVAAGASYVAFGRFFPSRTKPSAPCARLESLAAAKQRLAVPIVAIGGITPANGGALLAAGAGLLAVIEGVFGEDDPADAARRFRPLFDNLP
ncbi:thiamine phosphate synthase [Methylomagnum sp.]